jgi:hypothetical protein
MYLYSAKVDDVFFNEYPRQSDSQSERYSKLNRRRPTRDLRQLLEMSNQDPIGLDCRKLSMQGENHDRLRHSRN